MGKSRGGRRGRVEEGKGQGGLREGVFFIHIASHSWLHLTQIAWRLDFGLMFLNSTT